MAQTVLFTNECPSRDPHHRMHVWSIGVDRLYARKREQMTQKLAYRCLILLRALLNMPRFKRTVKVEHRTLIKGFAAYQHGLFQDFAGDAVHSPPYVTIDDMALAVRGRDGASRGAKVDSHVEGFACVTHRPAPSRIKTVWVTIHMPGAAEVETANRPTVMAREDAGAP